MEDHSGAVGPDEANRQAIATGGTTDQMVEDDQDTPPGRGGLVIAALGVVFGDIGTSPVYTFRECFNPEHGQGYSTGGVDDSADRRGQHHAGLGLSASRWDLAGPA